MYHHFDSRRRAATTASGIPIERGSYYSDSTCRLPKILALDGLDGRDSYIDDFDDRLSEQLLAVQSSLSKPLHQTDPFDEIPHSIPTAFSQGDLSVSPAATFLSFFSPSLSIRAPLPDDEGQTIAGHTLGPVVGRGGSSTIRTASSPSGDTVAIKIVRHTDTDRIQLVHEAEVWSSLHHEHILPLFTTQHTAYADYFITQYCPAGSLFDILKRDGRPALPQDDVGTMFRQVVRGLQYMHEIAGYVHGDIKPENVLVDEMGVCKIADFGMAKKIGQTEDDQQHLEPCRLVQTRKLPKQGLHTHLSLIRHNNHNKTHGSRSASPHRNSAPAESTLPPSPNQCYQQGSLPYAAPELLLPQIGSPYVPNPAQDIWALGVLLYILLTGRLPFADSFEPRLQMKILHGAFEMPRGIGCGAERVLQGCLDASVASRWTIGMVDEVAWGIGWGDVGDSATPRDDESETPCNASRYSPSVIISRSRSRQRGDRRYSPLSEPSVSRCDDNRSSSRTSSRSTSRDISRDRVRYTPPSLSALTTSIFGATSATTSPSWSLQRFTEDDRGRGRQLTKPTVQSNSKSRSPSLAPMTPTDPTDSTTPFLIHMKPRTTSDELSLDSGDYGRGRMRVASRDSLHVRCRGNAAELADIEEHSRWNTLSNIPDYPWAGEPDLLDASGIGRDKGTRAGSVPPHHVKFSAPCGTNWSHSTPVWIPHKMGSRSKSLGFGVERPIRRSEYV